MTEFEEIAPAKLNLALHVRGRLADGRHSLETIFAFCADGDRLSCRPAERLSLNITGPFAGALSNEPDNLVLKAARALADRAGVNKGAALLLDKRLPVASGIGGGSADAAAALRLLTRLWNIAPEIAQEVAPLLGSDVPACLAGAAALGTGAGDVLAPVDLGLQGTPVLLVNPRIALSTASVFAQWDGEDRGRLGDWRAARNDLERPASALAPQIPELLQWLSLQRGAWFARMSGSGATCFAFFETEDDLASAESAVSSEWWRLATVLR